LHHRRSDFKNNKRRDRDGVPTVAFQFECDCGEQLSESFGREGNEASFRVQCDNCKEDYVVTISSLGLDPIDHRVARDTNHANAGD
jgi:hypothetical protein